MKKEGTKVQSETEAEKMKEFFDEYQKLCDKYGLRIVVAPTFRARDDNTWSVVLQTSVGKLPSKQD